MSIHPFSHFSWREIPDKVFTDLFFYNVSRNPDIHPGPCANGSRRADKTYASAETARRVASAPEFKRNGQALIFRGINAANPPPAGNAANPTPAAGGAANPTPAASGAPAPAPQQSEDPIDSATIRYTIGVS